jgi:PAS domain S-box-containing protein
VFTRGEVSALYGSDLEMVGYSVVLLPSTVGPSSQSRAQRKRVVRSEMPDPGAFAGLLSNVDERFYVLDERFDFTYVNDQAAQIWGRSAEELVGNNLLVCFPEVLDTDFLAHHLKAANDGVIVRVEAESPLTQSKVELSIYPNRVGGVSVLIREPLDRHEGRDAVFSEERLAEAYAALELVVIDWEPASDWWRESATSVEVFGLEPGTVVGGQDRHLELIHPADRERYEQVVANALRDGDGWRVEYRIVRPVDGEVAWLEEDGKVVREPGRPLRCAVMAWDTTARKAAEEESRGNQRRLQRELANNRRLREIMARVAEADEPREALGQLLVAVSDLFAADRGAIRVLEREQSSLSLVAHHGFSVEEVESWATTDVNLVSFDREHQNTHARPIDARAVSPEQLQAGSWESEPYTQRTVPLMGLNGTVVGLMCLWWTRATRFSDRGEHDLAILAQLAASLVEHYVLDKRSQAVLSSLEQRAAQHGDELMQSEIRFRRAFEAGPVAACITTVAEDRFLEVNDGYVKLTGYSPEEVVGLTSRELGMWSSREDQAKLDEAFAQGGGFRELELKLRTKDGRVRDILLSGEQIEYHGHSSWLKMFNDVTDHHRSQEELMVAIREVMSDTAWFSQSVVQKLNAMRRGPTEESDLELTIREREVLELVAAGFDDDYIAARLDISRKTVRNHLTNMYAKTDVHSRAEAVIWARDRGIVARGGPASDAPRPDR